MTIKLKTDDASARECKHCGTPFVPKRPGVVHCSRGCNGRSQPKKFNPTADELRQYVWELPTQQLAEFYNVSDTAIAKRCKKMGITKPPRGYWNRLDVGKIDKAGNLTIPMIRCECGCGLMIPKWSGKHLRPRRCARGHNVNHNGGCAGIIRGSRLIDINVIAMQQCQREQECEMTAIAIQIALEVSERFFCEYIGPIWEAIAEAWETTREIEKLRLVARKAVKRHLRSTRKYADRSVDQMKECFGFEVPFA